ncbi:MAG: PepSY domain-containing protein [Alphaproteobacteria bacterium]
MKRARTIFTGLCLAAAVLLSSLPSWADSDCKHRGGAHKHRHDDHDHDRALNAVRRGEVMPLEQVMAIVSANFKGDVVHTRLERENGVWVYELKILARNGRMREVYINAKSGKPMNVEDD